MYAEAIARCTEEEFNALLQASRCAVMARGRGDLVFPVQMDPDLMPMFRAHLANLLECHVDAQPQEQRGHWVVSVVQE